MNFAVRSLATWIVFTTLLNITVAEQASADEKRDFFEARIRPVLVEKCYECHNSHGRKDGGLALDSRDSSRSGDSGSAIVPGKPNESILIDAIKHVSEDLKMPDGGPKLSDAVIADFEKWIADGAEDPRETPPSKVEFDQATSWEATLEKRRSWWSFRKLEPIRVVRAGDQLNQIIDRQLLAEMQKAGLAPNPQANKATLIRRLSFAIRGLPPSYEEVQAFVQDESPNAYPILVDRYLNSPEFGEHWARHWMDWFRYAESHGSEGDPRLPNAYRYRDYLIRAINQDVPYNQLVREHIAGDLLIEPRVDPATGINESMLGLGHFRMPYHGYAPVDPHDEQVRCVDNQVDVISKAFLGLTISCARCHNHKFDAIGQDDYYGWYGIFANTHLALRTVDQPAKLQKNRDELLRLKGEIKTELIKKWRSELGEFENRFAEEVSKREAELKTASEDPTHPLHLWHKLRGKEISERAQIWKALRDKYLAQQEASKAPGYSFHWKIGGEQNLQWVYDGSGIDTEKDAAGDFHISADGELAISNIYPAGIQTHSLSEKQNGFLVSPRFKVESDELWVRVRGGKGARVRFVMHDYPRVIGLLYLGTNLNSETDQWVKWDMTYWKGDMVHVEIATAGDLPVEANTAAERSWFGIAEIVARNLDQPAPSLPDGSIVAQNRELSEFPASDAELVKLYATTLSRAIDAWEKDSIDDSQASFLGYFVRNDLLNRSKSASPELNQLVDTYRELEKELAIPTRAPGIIDSPYQPQPLYVRGNHKTPGEIVPPHYLNAFDRGMYSISRPRMQLAESLVSKRNPLIGRVIVNRVWTHLFGEGFVATPDNFGQLGDPPTNQALLDTLAIYFTADAKRNFNQPWSLKELIRQIVYTEAFCRTSDVSEKAAELDPNNKLLSHFPVRRLESESIRDSLLDSAGVLSRDQFGESVPGSSNRRSVYVAVIRNSLDPFLSVFDSPEPSSTRGKRDATNVPAQSLALLNDPFVIQLAEGVAKRVDRAASVDERITSIFHYVLRREPTAEELVLAREQYEQSIVVRTQLATDLSRLRSEEAKLASEQQTIEQLIREKWLASRPDVKEGEQQTLPPAIARWDFAQGEIDSIGKLKGTLKGNAKIEGDSLLLDGESWFESQPLPFAVSEKTLQCRVILSDLNQRGGGVISVETLNGVTFDSIVFGEQTPQHWMAGSDGFSRTQSFNGFEEKQAAQEPVHFAIVYTKDGKIRGYRNGQPYGKEYASSGLMKSEAGASRILVGCRHSPATAGRFLRGRVLEVQLHDRALSPEEIEAFASQRGDYLPRDLMLKQMTDAERERWEKMVQERKILNKRIEASNAVMFGKVPNSKEEQELLALQDLAQSLFNVKEFIYVK